jgi:hypothetical protein
LTVEVDSVELRSSVRPTTDPIRRNAVGNFSEFQRCPSDTKKPKAGGGGAEQDVHVGHSIALCRPAFDGLLNAGIGYDARCRSNHRYYRLCVEIVQWFYLVFHDETLSRPA